VFFKALDCLRKASTDDLIIANQNVTSDALKLGMFPFGPAVDGDLVPELPAALLSKGMCRSQMMFATQDINLD
jgi:carboxylesterase type B